eukprot:14130954-Alexandrium_andersonii.AAC.1
MRLAREPWGNVACWSAVELSSRSARRARRNHHSSLPPLFVAAHISNTLVPAKYRGRPQHLRFSS